MSIHFTIQHGYYLLDGFGPVDERFVQGHDGQDHLCPVTVPPVQQLHGTVRDYFYISNEIKLTRMESR